MFDWCFSGQHDRCHRRYEKTYFETRRGKSVLVHTDEWVECQCKKRGCECYVPSKERNKPTKRRRKK